MRSLRRRNFVKKKKKKDMGVFRWESTKVSVMLMKFPVTLRA